MSVALWKVAQVLHYGWCSSALSSVKQLVIGVFPDGLQGNTMRWCPTKAVLVTFSLISLLYFPTLALSSARSTNLY